MWRVTRFSRSDGQFRRATARCLASRYCAPSELRRPPQGTGSRGPDGYELTIQPDGIEIQATALAGLFYGVQTLRQMLPAEARKTGLTLPCLRIQDKPRFRWRGLMLDNSRTFLSMGYLRGTVDRMAPYKLNILHLHLTDDQGWQSRRWYSLVRTMAASIAVQIPRVRDARSPIVGGP